MRAAGFAADWMRRRVDDAERVNIWECGTHLHVGRTGQAPEPVPDRQADRPVQAPPPLTWRIDPAQLAHLLGDRTTHR